MIKLLKELKGGSLSKTLVYQTESTKFIRKSISIFENREYGLVRWQSQVRKLQILEKHLPDNTLPILNMGIKDDFYYYDMPYLENADNLYEALKNGISTSLLAEKVFDLLSLMTKTKYNSIPGSVSVYVSEEIKSPILRAIEATQQNLLNLNKSETKTLERKLVSSIKFIDKIINEYEDKEVFECLTHGNFTLENALWDYKTNSIFFIDPYAETYCETILGDLSQLLQSSSSGYEYVSEIYESSKISILDYPENEIPIFLKNFSNELIKNVINSDWYSKELTLLLRASQFTRMFPFKLVNNPRLGALFMLHGLELLGEI
jgi:hypothetical protein